MTRGKGGESSAPRAPLVPRLTRGNPPAGFRASPPGPSVLAIDPGSAQSAWLRFDGSRPHGFGISANDVLVRALRTGDLPDVVVIEKVESYGMAVGAEVFDTVLWAGRFAEAAHRVPVVLLPRRAVKLALCGDSRARDANIRAALIDRFGGSAARGRKAAPGPLYGISRDVWSALAVAVAFADDPTRGEELL